MEQNCVSLSPSGSFISSSWGASSNQTLIRFRRAPLLLGKELMLTFLLWTNLRGERQQVLFQQECLQDSITSKKQSLFNIPLDLIFRSGENIVNQNKHVTYDIKTRGTHLKMNFFIFDILILCVLNTPERTLRYVSPATRGGGWSLA